MIGRARTTETDLKFFERPSLEEYFIQTSFYDLLPLAFSDFFLPYLIKMAYSDPLITGDPYNNQGLPRLLWQTSAVPLPQSKEAHCPTD